uniref:CHCH domain-containing protein n=1 Tax=Chromera velia CCMP2878 TaxID=1169474 RepID=A0A0G4HZ83_9ALVE|eukprot:Cvel_9672.t1-p1 / transcript=Cvel_9672.t1 / gene=Cvel_9672 / organism=Chromera_velia_CCMP2878 / gene_product=hypothetical protein / transcript_product=hypothetical protein / location=Cvel_scaffold563:45248-45659(+) / protein_length=96 / sequence_SO=supercontig / SO=protein_coding / is_pseudo=false
MAGLGSLRSLFGDVLQPSHTKQAQQKQESSPPQQQQEYEHEDVDDKVRQTGCEKEYAALDDCACDNDRNWKYCQKELAEFKRCFDKNKLQEQAGSK